VHVHGIHLHACKHNHQHLRQRKLGAELIGTTAAAEVYVVAGPEHLAEALPADGDGGAPRCGDYDTEGGKLHCIIRERATGEDGIEEPGGGGRGIVAGAGAAEVAEEEAVIKELGDAIESGVGDLGRSGLESEQQRVEGRVGGGGGQAEQRRGLRRGRVRRRACRR